MTEDEFRDYLTVLVDMNGSQRALAESIDVSSNYLSLVLAGKVRPGPAIYRPLGFERIVRYVQDTDHADRRPARHSLRPAANSDGA